VQFKTFQLFINSDFPKLYDLANVADHGTTIFFDNVEFYEIEKSILEKRFFWMYCQYDNSKLYTDTVWNKITEKEENNPRKKTQIECRNQLFVCYDMKKCLLYLNDITRRPFLKRYLHETLNKEVEIKNIIHSLEDFERSVQTIRNATFIQVRNIANSAPSSLFSQTANIYGFDAPESMQLKVDCGNQPIRKMVNSLRGFKRRNETGEFERVVVVGMDDSGIEKSFDFSSMIESVKIHADRDENQHFDPDEVRRLILNEIR